MFSTVFKSAPLGNKNAAGPHKRGLGEDSKNSESDAINKEYDAAMADGKSLTSKSDPSWSETLGVVKGCSTPKKPKPIVGKKEEVSPLATSLGAMKPLVGGAPLNGSLSGDIGVVQKGAPLGNKNAAGPHNMGGPSSNKSTNGGTANTGTLSIHGAKVFVGVNSKLGDVVNSMKMTKTPMGALVSIGEKKT